MRRYSYIVIIITLLLGRAGVGSAQDFSRLGERTIMGTARYVGMGGAMTAVGGDPSAVMDNPAGLGIYRRPEMLLTFDYSNIFMAPQASAVFTFRAENEPIQYHNFMLSYHRLHTFNRNYSGEAKNSPSLGALIASLEDVDLGISYPHDALNRTNDLTVRESGYVNEYGFDYAMNISDRWYWGLGLRIQSYILSSDGDYYETFHQVTPDNYYHSNQSRTSFLFSGVGVSGATGLICRPLQWLRVGFSIETPSVGSYDATTTGMFDALADSAGYSDAPKLRYEERKFHMPLHTSASVAFHIRKYALIALQYDYFHQSQAPDRHSFRVGAEVIPINGLYLNAGFALDATFGKDWIFTVDPTLMRQDTYFQCPKRAQYLSGAVGYRGRWFIVQAAYQYHMRHLHLYAHQNVTHPYDINQHTHRIVLTFGWHR